MQALTQYLQYRCTYILKASSGGGKISYNTVTENFPENATDDGARKAKDCRSSKCEFSDNWNMPEDGKGTNGTDKKGKIRRVKIRRANNVLECQERTRIQNRVSSASLQCRQDTCVPVGPCVQ